MTTMTETRPRAAAAALDTEFDAIVIGAGMSGLCQLVRLCEFGLKARAFEAGTGVGGTWYWNRYPGCRFDSVSGANVGQWSAVAAGQGGGCS